MMQAALNAASRGTGLSLCRVSSLPTPESETTMNDRPTPPQPSAAPASVWQGTLALMALRTLESLGPLHAYGIARRIEQVSGDKLSVNYGTLYPALLKLEQEGYISAKWGVSGNNRKAKYYALTRAGKKKLEREARQWEETTAIIARFFVPGEEVS